MVKTGGRQLLAKGAEQHIQMMLHRHRQRRAFQIQGRMTAKRGRAIGDRRGTISDRGGVEAQLCLNQLLGDRLLRIKGGQAPNEIFQLADIARPAMTLHALKRASVDILERQALLGGELEEMAHQVRYVLGTFT